VKKGVKMRVAADFGYEPSLIVEMDREQDLKNNGRLVRSATILGDRYGTIDAKRVIFPSTADVEKAMGKVYDFFKPHIDMLTPGAWAPVDLDKKTDFRVDESGDDGWAAEKKSRTILCEEIQGELVRHYPGQTAAEKQAKLDLIEKFFGTRSWTKVESTVSEKLREGLKLMRENLTKEKTDA